MKKKSAKKKFVSYKKLKKTNEEVSTNVKQYALSLREMRKMMTGAPPIILSLTELETGKLDSPADVEKLPIISCWKYLKKNYPRAFSIAKPKPLKLKINYHICRNKINYSMDAVDSALASYTRQPKYVESLTASSERIGLDGKAIGKVSTEQVESAQQMQETNA